MIYDNIYVFNLSLLMQIIVKADGVTVDNRLNRALESHTWGITPTRRYLPGFHPHNHYLRVPTCYYKLEPPNYRQVIRRYLPESNW